jgi:hypothetical protein
MGQTTVPFGFAYGVEEHQACGELRHAAIVALDEALMDVALAARARRARPELGSTRALPVRYEELYDVEFLKQWTVAVAVVGLKLAQAERMPLACLAEKLALNAMMVSADARARDRGSFPLAFDGLRRALGDTGFLVLFDEAVDVDGDLRFEAWFDGFGETPCGEPHPFYPAHAAVA